MKEKVFAICGLLGAGIAQAFGGWDSSMITLITVMGVDYITGIIVAGVFHKSKKSSTGSLKSAAGWKGLCKKGVQLLIVLVAFRIDDMIGSDYVRDCVIIAFVANELLSIIENAGLMGIPLPKVLVKAVDLLQSTAGEKEAETDERQTENC